jgi:hypothetical protein
LVNQLRPALADQSCIEEPVPACLHFYREEVEESALDPVRRKPRLPHRRWQGCQLHLRVVFSTVQGAPEKTLPAKMQYRIAEPNPSGSHLAAQQKKKAGSITQ